MKKITFLFALLCASVMGWADPTPYCGVTSPNEDFTFSLMNVSGNLYRVQFDAIGDVKFGSSPYNNNCGVNQTDGAGIYFGNAANWVMTDDRAYYDFTTASEASVPTNFYGNYFCFNKKGGGLIEISGFNPADVDWSATCGTSCDDSQKPVVSAVAVGEITYNSAILTITASDNVAVTRYVVKNGDVQLAQGTSNVITLANLAPATSYDNIKVYAYDACNNESDVFNVTSFTTDSRSYCRFATGHLSDPAFGDIYGRILLTIKKVNETTIAVRVEPNNNGTKGIKYLNIIVDGVNHEYGNIDGSGDDLTGFFEISGLTDLDFTFNLYFYCNTPNWTTNQFNVTESELCTEEPMILTEGSEYCEYGVPCAHGDGDFAYLSWNTTEDGDVVISIVDGVNSTNARFRGNGFEGDFDAGFKVLSGANFSTEEVASKYFNRILPSGDKKSFTLQRKGGAVLPSPAKIRFSGPALAWLCDQHNDGYRFESFTYTYGKICPVVSGYAVSASANDGAMGSATATVNSEPVTHVDAGTTVTFTATTTDNTYTFVNWTKGGVEVSTNPVYELEINEATALVANFDYVRNTYCHAEVTSTEGKKFYLTLGAIGEGQYQIKFEGSSEAKITGINDANYQINGVSTSWDSDGVDVPFSKANGAWTYEESGYGSVYTTFGLAEGKTWRDIYVWLHYMYFACEGMGQQTLTDVLPNRYRIAWNASCSDAEAPVFAKASGAVLDANSVRLTIQATDNWEGLLTYTIAREAAEPIISQHASGEEFTQDVTGLTTGTEYTFTVTVSDGVNNTNQNIVITPVGDETKPDMGEASLASKTWNKAIIDVAATDNIGVVAYYIVELDADYVATEGKITVEGLTAATEYTLHIKAKDAAGNLSDDAAEVSFTTDAHELVPTTAAPVPTWPAAQVKSIYSDAYALAPANTPNYNAPWWKEPGISFGDINGDHYMDYDLADEGMIGWQYDQISIASMEQLHIDIYASAAGTVSVRPITDGDGALNDNRKSLTLAAQQWNSFDIELSEFGAHDWTKLFQFSIEYWDAGGLTGEHISVDNVYFYRTTELVDNEKPTNINASVTKAAFGAITLNVSGEDNEGTVLYSIKIGETEYANGAAASGASKAFTLNGLTPGKSYNINVIASDESGNFADPVVVVAQTNALTPAPVPTHNAALVRSIYCDTYETALAHDFSKNTWTGIPYTELNLSGDHVLAYTNPNTPAQMPDIAWGVNNDGADAIIAKDGFNDGENKGLDVRNMQFIHFDIWSATATNYPELRLNDTQAGSIVLNGSGWQSFDMDISSLTNEQKSNIRWIKFIGLRDPAPEDIVIDNVYFWAYGASTNPAQGTDAGGWATFAAPIKLAVPVGLTAYKASYEKTETEEILNLTEISVIPANAGVILKGTESEDYILTPTDAEASDVSDNVLVGCVTRTDVSDVRATKDIFCMRYSGSFDMTGFFLYEGQYVPAGKAYLPLPKPSQPSSAPRKVRFVIKNEQTTTGIENTGAEAVEATKFIENGQLYIRRGEAVYTIQGVRVK